MARPKIYPDELVARGGRLALESERAIAHIAADLLHPETLRKKVRQHEADSGARPEMLSSITVSAKAGTAHPDHCDEGLTGDTGRLGLRGGGVVCATVGLLGGVAL